jgi:hypothetical protein
MQTDKYTVWDEGVAAAIDGRSDDGDRPLELGPDVLIHWRLGAVEQGALNRVAMSDEMLSDEINKVAGKVALGSPEDLREFLHEAVDAMFTAIYVHRGLLTKEQGHNIRQGTSCLDDEIMGPEAPGENNGEE